jgi:hypothetical protein
MKSSDLEFLNIKLVSSVNRIGLNFLLTVSDKSIYWEEKVGAPKLIPAEHCVL